MKEIIPFFTPFFEYEIDLKDANRAADYLLKLKENNEQSEERSNEGGWHSQDWGAWDSPEELHPVLRVIHNNMNEVYKRYNFGKQPQLSNCWGIINNKGDYNTQHNHGGTYMSGVVYLRVPEGRCGRLVLVRDNILLSTFTGSIPKEPNDYRNGRYYIVPETRKGIIFPWHLEHYVEPNETNEDRIILSYNFV